MPPDIKAICEELTELQLRYKDELANIPNLAGLHTLPQAMALWETGEGCAIWVSWAGNDVGPALYSLRDLPDRDSPDRKRMRELTEQFLQIRPLNGDADKGTLIPAK